MKSPQSKPSAITLRRTAFAEHFAGGKSVAEAARLAGYTGSKRTLEKTGARLLSHPAVQQRIQEVAAQASKDRVATAEEMKQFLTNVLRGEARATINVFGTAVEVGPTMAERLRAVEILAKVQGLFIDRKQIEGQHLHYVVGIPAPLPGKTHEAQLLEWTEMVKTESGDG